MILYGEKRSREKDYTGMGKEILNFCFNPYSMWGEKGKVGHATQSLVKKPLIAQ